ncbi:hypothetical protein J6590_021493 [Homalodisca vitripennis]|nr:hypothetical protein J6590_021493 [Homalodisca vitripennis]
MVTRSMHILKQDYSPLMIIIKSTSVNHDVKDGTQAQVPGRIKSQSGPIIHHCQSNSISQDQRQIGPKRGLCQQGRIIYPGTRAVAGRGGRIVL